MARVFVSDPINDGLVCNFEKEIVDIPKSMSRCHYHQMYEIYYLYKGERKYFIHDQMYHLKKGDLVIIPPNTSHASFNCENSQYERFLINVDTRYIQDCAKQFNEIDFFEFNTNNLFVFSFTPDEQICIENIFNNIFNLSASGDFSRSHMQISVMQILFHIYLKQRISQKGNPSQPTPISNTLSTIMSYIQHNYEQSLTLESIATANFISPSYLSRIFKESIGISPINYVNSIRIKEAKLLLSNSDKSITHIAHAVGFNSNTHFGRIFKASTGLSPLQYRNDFKHRH